MNSLSVARGDELRRHGFATVEGPALRDRVFGRVSFQGCCISALIGQDCRLVGILSGSTV